MTRLPATAARLPLFIASLLLVSRTPDLASQTAAAPADSQFVLQPRVFPKPLVSKQDALIWGAALAAAAVADLAVRDFAQGQRSAFTNDAASVGNSLGTAYVWAPALVGTWLVGVAAGESKLAKAAAWAAASGTVSGGITALAKATFGRKRPPAGDATSETARFPRATPPSLSRSRRAWLTRPRTAGRMSGCTPSLGSPGGAESTMIDIGCLTLSPGRPWASWWGAN